MTIRKKPNYLLIGIFMAVGILGILTSVLFADKLVNRLKGGYPIYITFNNLDGLVPGSKVVVGSGKNVGQIETIELDGPTLVVEAFIDHSYQINKDARFEIFSTSFVGGKYLAIENFTGEGPYLEKGTIVMGNDPLSINSILESLGGAFESGSAEGVATSLGQIVESTQEAIARVNNILAENQEGIKITIDNVAISSKHLESTLANVDRKLKGVSDKEFKAMMKDIQRSLNNLDIFLKDINSPNAPLSILKDPSMTHSIKTIITNLEETTERIKAKPSLLLRS